MRFLTALAIALVAQPIAMQQCCSGAPCGDGCISIKKTCRKRRGSATCKIGKHCACEWAAHKAWQSWSAFDHKPEGQPENDDPWLLDLYHCFWNGGTFASCLAGFVPKLEV
mmetsp:Transcript_2880/g.4901  ORF Transcript_2880/g.4901 Transcript_2880/m.4901 type:complete len:111 (+) Transcript_2880:31-363(+)